VISQSPTLHKRQIILFKFLFLFEKSSFQLLRKKPLSSGANKV
jgi:hypothetical protein